MLDSLTGHDRVLVDVVDERAKHVGPSAVDKHSNLRFWRQPFHLSPPQCSAFSSVFHGRVFHVKYSSMRTPDATPWDDLLVPGAHVHYTAPRHPSLST